MKLISQLEVTHLTHENLWILRLVVTVVAISENGIVKNYGYLLKDKVDMRRQMGMRNWTVVGKDSMIEHRESYAILPEIGFIYFLFI